MIVGAHLHYNQYFGLDYYYDYLGMPIRTLISSWSTFYYTDLLLYVPTALLFIKLGLTQIKVIRNNMNKENIE